MREPKMALRSRFFRMMAKCVVNPGMRRAVPRGLAPGSVALIETTGRRSGRPRRTPVLNGLDGDVFWLFAEHGRDADYVKNLLAEPCVRVLAAGAWRSGAATVMPDRDAMRHRREIGRRHGAMGWLDGLVFRAAASDPLAIRVDLDPGGSPPDH
jgi:deazaflavin-dependent oxidoreductase (nitroreductase family)